MQFNLIYDVTVKHIKILHFQFFYPAPKGIHLVCWEILRIRIGLVSGTKCFTPDLHKSIATLMAVLQNSNSQTLNSCNFSSTRCVSKQLRGEAFRFWFTFSIKN